MAPSTTIVLIALFLLRAAPPFGELFQHEPWTAACLAAEDLVNEDGAGHALSHQQIRHSTAILGESPWEIARRPADNAVKRSTGSRLPDANVILSEMGAAEDVLAAVSLRYWRPELLRG